MTCRGAAPGGALRGGRGPRPLVTAAALAALLAGAIAGCRLEPSGVTLRFRFVPGEEHAYRHQVRWEGRIESPGASPRTFHRREDSEIRRIVESLDPVTMVATLREVAETRARESRIDATRDRSWTREIVLRVGEDGRLVEVDGMERKSGFAGLYYLEKVFEQAMPVFPPRPILPGHSWTQRRDVPLPSGETTVAEATFTYVGTRLLRERRCAVLRVTNRLVIPFEEDGQRGVDESTGRGHLYIDVDDGLLVREEIERDVEPKRYRRVGDRQVLMPGRILYHSSETLELLDTAPAAS